MKAGKRTFYWDTNVFVAWLKGETIWPRSVIVGMDDVAREVHENRAILFTSTLTSAEIYQGSLSKTQRDKLAALMQRSNVSHIAPDTRITERAGAIREFYNVRGDKLKTPDAIHVATAIIYKADEMQTLDGFDIKNPKKTTKLLALNGDVAGYNLTIVPPYPFACPPAEIVVVKGPLFGNKASIQ
jgi:predicted nucleic acid-binding protein